MSHEILALDLATKTGWAVTVNQSEIVSGTWNMSKKAKDNELSLVLKFRDHLNDIKTKHPKIGQVVWERVDFARYVMAHALHNQLLGVLKLWCADNHLPLMPVPVGTLKRHATGQGNSDKVAMTNAAIKKWLNNDFVDDNEVDARWLADYAITENCKKR